MVSDQVLVALDVEAILEEDLAQALMVGSSTACRASLLLADQLHGIVTARPAVDPTPRSRVSTTL